ncbi:uncharacterized protein LOC135276388 [Aotus nancymaae]|uniref:uncharacterized protein LOC135276388 n=1 Tax=Aotus nancymaae TaxID=37293 RepID=UPI0030FE9989
MQLGSIPRPSPVPGAPPASEPSTWPQGRRDHPPPIPSAPPCLPSPSPVSSPPLPPPPPLSGRRFGGPDLVLAGNRGLRLNGPALGKGSGDSLVQRVRLPRRRAAERALRGLAGERARTRKSAAPKRRAGVLRPGRGEGR